MSEEMTVKNGWVHIFEPSGAWKAFKVGPEGEAELKACGIKETPPHPGQVIQYPDGRLRLEWPPLDEQEPSPWNGYKGTKTPG